MSPIWLARLFNFPSNGGTLSRSDAAIIPGNSYPSATYGGSSSSNGLPTFQTEMEPATQASSQQSPTMDVEDYVNSGISENLWIVVANLHYSISDCLIVEL